MLTAVRLTRAHLPTMIDNGWGRVLSIASDSAVAIPAEMIHYGMTKTSLLAMSRGFAKAAAGTGVTVNSVIAGPTHTGGVEDFVHELVDSDLPWDEAQREFIRAHRPQSLLQRLIGPAEIANLVVYLASPLASAATGPQFEWMAATWTQFCPDKRSDFEKSSRLGLLSMEIVPPRSTEPKEIPCRTPGSPPPRSPPATTASAPKSAPR